MNVAGVPSRISDLAGHIRDEGALRGSELPAVGEEYARVEEIEWVDADGHSRTERVRLGPRESLVRSTEGDGFCIVGDLDGDEKYRLRIFAVTSSGVNRVHEESPVAARAYAFGGGYLWTRCDAALRPHQLLWWGRDGADVHILAREPDRTRRLSLRSVEAGRALLFSRGGRRVGCWVVHDVREAVPVCRVLEVDADDVDVVLSAGDIAVLDRSRGNVTLQAKDGGREEAPPGFLPQSLHTVGSMVMVVGRRNARQSVWVPELGPDAVWDAPPAGTMLPSVDAATRAPLFLVSSPAHEAHVVRPVVGHALQLTSTGRAETRILTAWNGDAAVPITVFEPPGVEKRPLVVHVYGAYGISLEGPFDPFTDDLLSRGIAVGYCHVRGGGERGLMWHRQATGVNHELTIGDLLACLALLRSDPGIDGRRIVLSGASAGGLMAAEACLRAPSWCCGLLLVHPFLDPVASLRDEKAALSSTDWAEFGDPGGGATVRAALNGISPMQSVEQLAERSCPLPRAWIRMAEDDARVEKSAIDRFSQLYRAAAQCADDDHVILRASKGGHLGGAPQQDARAENLLAHAWIVDALTACVDRATHDEPV